jgi:long-subunit fatty acid transport protein
MFPERWSAVLRVLIALCLCTVATALAAQTNERMYEDLNFHFVTPGARASAMGKTFIGLADDATAAVSNPAGLSNLLEKEFSFEFTRTRLKHKRFFPQEGTEVETFGGVVLTPSFFSYVIPVRRATLAVFRNAIQNYREEFQLGERAVPALNSTEDETFGNVAIRVETYGLGGAYVLTPRLSVGGSITLVSLDLASAARSGTPLNPRNGTNTIDADLGWGALAGAIFKPVPRVALGFTFNKGTVFDVTTHVSGLFLFTLPGTSNRIDVRRAEDHAVNYVVPDRYTAGTSWRARNGLTLLMDVSRVNYSQQITDRFLIVDFQDPDARVTPSNFFINDVYELHGGAEWRRYGPRGTVSFRAGLFTDPDHRLRFRSGGNNLQHPADATLNFRFNTGASKTDVGVTAGAGVTLRNRIQIDAASSFSPNASDVVVSMVVRLP